MGGQSIKTKPEGALDILGEELERFGEPCLIKMGKEKRTLWARGLGGSEAQNFGRTDKAETVEEERRGAKVLD